MLVEAVARRLVSDMADPHALETRHIVQEGHDVRGGEPGLDLVVAGRDPKRPDRGRAVARHAPDLAGHLDRRGLAVGPGHRDHRLGIGRVELRCELGEAAARDRVREVRHLVDLRLGPGDDRDRPSVDRLGDEILAVKNGAAEGAEDASTRDLAMVERKARHLGLAVGVRKLAQAHGGSQSFESWTKGSTWLRSGSRSMYGATPSIGAIRLIVWLTTGATFHPA